MVAPRSTSESVTPGPVAFGSHSPDPASEFEVVAPLPHAVDTRAMPSAPTTAIRRRAGPGECVIAGPFGGWTGHDGGASSAVPAVVGDTADSTWWARSSAA